MSRSELATDTTLALRPEKNGHASENRPWLDSDAEHDILQVEVVRGARWQDHPNATVELGAFAGSPEPEDWIKSESELSMIKGAHVPPSMLATTSDR